MRGMLKPKGSALEDFKAVLEESCMLGKRLRKLCVSERAAQARCKKIRKQELSQGYIRLCLRWILETTQNLFDMSKFLFKVMRW